MEISPGLSRREVGSLIESQSQNNVESKRLILAHSGWVPFDNNALSGGIRALSRCLLLSGLLCRSAVECLSNLTASDASL